MSNLFDKTVVVKVGDDDEKIRVSMEIDGASIAGDTFITNFSGGGASNVQLDRTFGGKLLVTAFGERLEQFSFSGLSAPDSCSGGTSSGSDLGAFYRQYRAGNSGAATPVLKLAFDSNVFRGVILGMNVQPWNVDNRILQYTITAMGSIV